MKLEGQHGDDCGESDDGDDSDDCDDRYQQRYQVFQGSGSIQTS